jgi:hypothetical protein
LIGHFSVVHGCLVRPPLPKVIDAVALGAAVLLQFLRCRGHQPELDLLRCELEENLLSAFVGPRILPSPHEVYVVGPDDKAVKPYPFVADHELEAVHQYVFALIGQQERPPVEAGCCEKLDAVVHASSYGKKQVPDIAGGLGGR